MISTPQTQSAAEQPHCYADGECKARLWQPDGGERGDGRGGILEGYTNLVQSGKALGRDPLACLSPD